MSQLPATSPPTHILFLDGECVFCQRSAQVIHKIDHSNLFNFAPLQGETASMLPEAWRLHSTSSDPSVGAVVLVENTGEQQSLWRGADAVLRTLKLIGGVWAVFWPLRHFPDVLKNGIYHWIAKNRYRIAGKSNTCKLPDTDFQNKLLP